MSISFDAKATRTVVKLDGVDRVAFNEDGSMELLTPPSAAPDANDVPTFGTSLVRATAQNATGTAIDFTGIPSWAKKITVMLDQVSTSGTSVVMIRLGTSSGVDAAGYAVTVGYITGTTQCGLIAVDTTGINTGSTLAIAQRNGTITLHNVSGNTWVVSGLLGDYANDDIVQISGRKALAGPLDRIRLTTVNGTDTFDAGSVNIMWE